MLAEVIRLYVPSFSDLLQHEGVPHVAADDTTIQGYTIPKDSLIFANIWAVHHDHALWNDPEVFRPERFLDESGVVLQPDYYMPFSIGTFILENTN